VAGSGIQFPCRHVERIVRLPQVVIVGIQDEHLALDIFLRELLALHKVRAGSWPILMASQTLTFRLRLRIALQDSLCTT